MRLRKLSLNPNNTQFYNMIFSFARRLQFDERIFNHQFLNSIDMINNLNSPNGHGQSENPESANGKKQWSAPSIKELSSSGIGKIILTTLKEGGKPLSNIEDYPEPSLDDMSDLAAKIQRVKTDPMEKFLFISSNVHLLNPFLEGKLTLPEVVSHMFGKNFATKGLSSIVMDMLN